MKEEIDNIFKKIGREAAKKTFLPFLFIMLFSMVIVMAIAEEKNNEDIPPGMEVIVINRVRHLVPKGTKIYEKGGVQVLEGRNEYMAGRFEDIDKRLESLKEGEKKLILDVEQLKKIAEKLQKSNEGLRSELTNLKGSGKPQE